MRIRKHKSKAVSPPTAKEPVEDLPAQLPGIAVESGLGRVVGNTKLYRKLLGKFWEKNQEADREIRELIENGDLEQAAGMTHAVKGVAGNLGAEGLFQVAGELEKSLKENDLELLEEKQEAFRSSLSEVMTSIEGLKLGDRSPTGDNAEATDSKAPVDNAALGELITTLIECLETDLPQATEHLERLGGYLESTPAREEFQQLEKHLEGFDTDSAAASLKTIAEKLSIQLDSPEV